MEWDKAKFVELEKERLEQINSALKRMKEGVYGYCIDSDEPISEKRLRANPLALRTVEAQEEFDKKK